MSDIILIEQLSASTTPAIGRVVIYPKNDGYLYFKNDTGQETRVNMQVTKTAAQWVSSNPVLAEGVFGVETDTMKFKIGDGVTQWNALAYWRYTAEHLTINTAGGNTVLTLSQARASSFAITGALVSNANIIVQDTMALFVAENLTSGAHTVTFKTAAGTGIAVPQGAHVTLYADGVNVENPVTAGPGAGDVVGPASSVNGKVAVFSGTTGKLLSDSGVTLGTAAANNTGDFAAALGANDNYVTDAEKIVIGNTSGANSGDNATNTQYSGLATSKQDTLVSGTNIKTVNSTTLLGSGNISVEVAGAAATAESNAKAYADTLVVGLWDDRGAYDASVNTFPASGGSGTAGAILKGDIWVIGAAGTLGGVSVGIGDTVRALTNTPGQIISSWALQENNIGYVPENVANKVTSLSGASTDTQYPSAKLAYDQLALKANLNSPTFTGTVGGITAAMVGAPSGSGTSSGTNTGDQTPTSLGLVIGTNVQAYDADLTTWAGVTPGTGVTAFLATPTLANLNTAVTDADLLGTTGVGSDLTLARIAGSTYSTIQHWRNNLASAGIIAGGVMSDAGGATINVTGGSCAIRATTSHLSTLYFADFPANNGIAIPANTIRYVGIEYNAGSPIIAIRATDDFDYMTNFPIGVVVNEAGVLHLHTADRHDISDAASHVAERFEHTANFARDEVIGGLILGETGTRNITMSAGAMWQKLLKITVSAFNSSTGGTFDIYYRDGAGSFTKVAAATQWPNLQYDNNTGTLATLANNKFGTLWFYLEPDDGMIIMLYGRAEHGSIAAAEAEAPPATVPNRVTVGGRLIGRLVFAKSAAAASSISSVFTTTFSSGGAASHANLSNLDYASAGHTGFATSAQGALADSALQPAAIGTTVQAYDADLTTWAGVTPGTGVATALAVAVGSAGAPVVNGGALGTPSSGTVTNLTGTASININGTVGGTTPAAGAFTTLSATTTTAAAHIFRQNTSTSYTTVRLYNDLNSGSRALSIDYAGSAYAGALITGGAIGESAAISTSGNFPISLGVSNSEVARISSTGLAVTGSITSTVPAAGAFTTLSASTTSGNAYATISRASQAQGQVGINIGGGTSGTDWIIYQPTSSNILTFFGESANRMELSSTGLAVTGTIKGSTTIGVGNATPAASGAGITFPATQSASSDANTLDDYEEGTWTPGFGTGWTTSPTVATTGAYVKIGRQVTISIYLLNGVSSAGALITGLPFTVGVEASMTGFSGSTSTAPPMHGVAQGGAVQIRSIPAATMTGLYWTCSVTYFV